MQIFRGSMPSTPEADATWDAALSAVRNRICEDNSEVGWESSVSPEIAKRPIQPHWRRLLTALVEEATRLKSGNDTITCDVVQTPQGISVEVALDSIEAEGESTGTAFSPRPVDHQGFADLPFRITCLRCPQGGVAWIATEQLRQSSYRVA